MQYETVTSGRFLARPNRFLARVELDGREETVHVKNTGRCRELLLPGAEVWLTRAGNPARKTQYDLIAVRKESGLLVNIDSQAPNRAAREWLETRGFQKIVPEYGFGDSRIDFYMERCGARFLLEVKGCTLEIDGVGYFPDAPTERGVKHLQTLAAAAGAGWQAAAAFVIQMNGVTQVRPNVQTHPAFAAALREAMAAGVAVWFLECRVTPESLTVCAARRASIDSI